MRLSPSSNVDGLYKFYPLGDTTSTLEPVDASGALDNHFWIHGTGDQDLRTDDASDPFAPIYNPTRFRLYDQGRHQVHRR